MDYESHVHTHTHTKEEVDYRKTWINIKGKRVFKVDVHRSSLGEVTEGIL